MFTLDMYRSIVPHFDILNLIPVDMSSESIITTTATTNTNSHNTAHSIASSSSSSSFMNQSGNRFVKSFSKNKWHKIGNITYDQANLNTIMYIGMDKLPNYVLYATNMNHQKQYHHHHHHHHHHHQQQQNIVVDNNEEMTVNIDNIDDDHFTTLHMSSGSGSGSSTSSSSGKPRFRVVTNIAPPFVIESTKLDNNTCLIGDFCLKVLTNVRDDLISIFTDFRSQRRQFEGHNYQVNCCAGIAIDLLNAVARDLHFDYDLYLVADGLFGIRKDGKWDGVTADLVNDVAHLSFTAFSTTSSRVQAIDYSVPFFYSGVSCLSSVSSYSDVRLLAFLIPFSYELWAAIFASLVATAIAAAIYEWFSPFGLNPWGRQRTKNFSLASALWVMCSLLFSHLVAFKAPKSWPNKVLINVWGAFSVIFLATYTANIAAHFAGFLLPEVNDFHDSSLMKQRTGTARSSASEGYLMEKYTELWHHIQRYKVDSFDAGLESLRNDKLDVLIGDTAILDYYRANDPGCNLRLLGDSIFDDAYAIGMQKGFPFRESISNLILKYNEYGFLDQLHRKWYGRVHCLESTSLSKPEPLTVRGVAGVFLMLTIGILVGIIILLAEHFTFKYLLPGLRKKPKDCFWKSPNLMFFSQKLYRFINTVELVSPHHSAKEIITNLREGQIASLFQKSVKRKAKEEARRRKSKSQFFEMIQEVRKVVHLQQTERSMQQDDDDHDDHDDDDNDDDDDDDLSSSDLIDEEAALNTNTNMRVTRPSFSLSKDELIEMEFNHQNRVSSIRFREPNDMNHDTIYHPPSIPPAPPPPPPPSSSSSIVERKSKSNLKISNESKKLNSSTDSQQDVIVEHAHRLRYHQRRRRSSSSSTQRHSKQMETVQSRRKKLLQTHTHSTSFSLENICFEGILSEGISDQNEKRKNFRRRRILSFEDLPAIKKELSESSQEGDHYSMIESEQYRHYTTKSIRPIRKSKLKSLRHQTMTTSLSSSSSAAAAVAAARSIDIGRLSRNEILNLWNSSEKELLNRLEMTIQQNRVLEEKIKLLQRMLKKPP
nr:glutamate receptor ionotropic, NMDA 2B-like isoform X1 [Dermatophagoides farinae]